MHGLPYSVSTSPSQIPVKHAHGRPTHYPFCGTNVRSNFKHDHYRVLQVEKSVRRLCMCLYVQTITFDLMTFDLYIWHAGPSLYRQGRVQKFR